MSPDERLADAQDAWQVAFEAGHDRPVADLLPDAPDLQPELERRVAVLRRMLTAQQQAPPAVAPAGPISLPPGFVFERELGRGGMGVVYLARQAGLNRLAAVKMILDAAGPSAVIRFLAEAEAVASVKHPNVVEVYQFGEHHGKPYLALEFCAGGDLTAKSKGGRNDPRQSAELMAAVADGVNAAHSAGIVHRDLKPGNILLAADGTPKVSDFGLAKKGGGAELTGSEAVLGTAAYMSPEQAGGGTKFVGPECDVWALGVMLYELLTGVRPFAGPSFLDYRIQILGRQLTPLRQAFPDVPRDLELIVAKCLRQEPRERYATAGELAADLRNWLTGRPISARPMGSVEAAWKWSRRNPAVAGSLAVATLALVVGTVVSLWQAWEANYQARLAAGRADDLAMALEEKGLAEAEARRNEVSAQRSLAKALLGPISADTRKDALTPYELDAIWQLVELRGGPVGGLVIEEGFRTPQTTERFVPRSDLLDHAVIGLSSRRQRDVDALYAKLLEDPSCPHDVKVLVVTCVAVNQRDAVAELAIDTLFRIFPDAASSISAMGLFDLLDEMVRQIPEGKAADVWCRADEAVFSALGKAVDESVRRETTLGLAAVAERVSVSRSAEVDARTAELLSAALTTSKDDYEQEVLAKGLTAVIARQRADQAAEVWGQAAEAFISAMRVVSSTTEQRTIRDGLVKWLVEGLVVATSKLPADRETRVNLQACEVLVAALPKSSLISNREQLLAGVETITRGLSAEQADEVNFKTAEKLATTLETHNFDRDRSAWTERVTEVVGRLPAEKMAELLAAAFGKIGEDYSRRRSVEELVGLIQRMPMDKAGDVFARTIGKVTVTNQRSELTKRLAEVASQLPKDQAATVCGKAAEVFASALAKASYNSERVECALGLAAVAGRLPKERAAKVCGKAAEVFAAALAKAGDNSERVKLAEGLVSLARWLPTEQAAEVCGRAANLLATALNEAPFFNQEILAKQLVAMTSRLPAGQAIKVLSTPVDEGVSDSGAWVELVKGLADRLPPDKGIELCVKAAEMFATALGKSESDSERLEFTSRLTAVAGRLPKERAAELCGKAAEVLASALAKATEYSNWNELAEGLIAVAGRLPADQKAEVCGRAAKLVVTALRNATNISRMNLAKALTTIVEQRPAEKAAECMKEVATALAKAPNYHRADLAKLLVAVAGRLPADQGVEVLVAALSKATDTFEKKELADGLTVVVGRLPADRAAETCDKVAEVLSTASNNSASQEVLVDLAKVLVAVAGRLPVDQADRGFEVLTSALSKPTGTLGKEELLKGLAAVALHLPPNQTVRGIAMLQDLLDNSSYPDTMQELAKGLAALAGRLPADQTEWGCELLTSALSKPGLAIYARRELAIGLTVVSGQLFEKKGIKVLVDALGKANDDRFPGQADQDTEKWLLVKGLAGLVGRLPSDEAADVLFSVMYAATSESHFVHFADRLLVVLTGVSRLQHLQLKHPGPLAAVVGTSSLAPADLYKPQLLPAQTLVELLKHPLCVWRTRRVVLDALEMTFRREFRDLTDFVTFAAKEHPELDLITPPKRPERE